MPSAAPTCPHPSRHQAERGTHAETSFSGPECLTGPSRSCSFLTYRSTRYSRACHLVQVLVELWIVDWDNRPFWLRRLWHFGMHWIHNMRRNKNHQFTVAAV